MSQRKVKNLLNQYSHLQLVDYKDIHHPWVDPTKAILISSQWPDGEILKIATKGQFHSFLNSQNRDYESELATALRVCHDPRAFLSNPVPILFATSPKVIKLSFLKSTDKADLLAQIIPFLEPNKSRLVLEHSRFLFEELFMNAVYDAPAEAAKLKLPSKINNCEMLLAYDNEKITISCFDSYGSLEPLNMVKRISDIQSSGTKDIINLGQRTGGAGIGCSLLYNYSTSIVIVVEPGGGTRVSCSIPLKINSRQFFSTGKNLQVFIIEPLGGNHG